MTFRVLCTGDIHIGRRSSKVTETFRSADAWYAIVDTAIREQVDLLAISGDVVDKESKSYESLGPLQDGLARLAKAGIETVAVTGNHDHDVLVRLAGIAGADRFHLLGQGGRWERHTVLRAGDAALHVDGWSFPAEHVTEAPMRAYSRHVDDGLPVLGLLHGDVGIPLSRYAPIQLADLWAHAVDCWLLGHIHAPRTFQGPGHAVAFYPGSPWALDPGEPGTHGVWLAEFGEDRRATLLQLPISPVRYQSREVDVGGVTDEGAFLHVLSQALIALGKTAIADHGEGSLKVVSSRLRFTGRCPAHRSLPAWIEQARLNIGPFTVDSVTVEIDEMTSAVHPPIDLALLAQGADPAAETARLILALDQPALDPLYETIVRDTLRELTTISQLPAYARLPVQEQDGQIDGPTEDDALALLRLRAWDVMSALVAQREQA